MNNILKQTYIFDEESLINTLCDHRLFFMKKMRELSMLNISPGKMVDAAEQAEISWCKEFIRSMVESYGKPI